jgi:hypothetical protein
MRASSKLAVIGAVLAVVAVGGLAKVAVAAGSSHDSSLSAQDTAAAQDDAPTQDNGGSIVEDGAYPNAAAIEADQHIQLISGDGHIVLVDCATPPVNNVGVLKVHTTNDQIDPDGLHPVCFKITATPGVLNLMVPGVYEIRGDGQVAGTGHTGVTADVKTDNGPETSVAVKPDGSTPVGIGVPGNEDPTTLLQLKVTS